MAPTLIFLYDLITSSFNLLGTPLKSALMLAAVESNVTKIKARSAKRFSLLHHTLGKCKLTSISNLLLCSSLAVP